MDPPGGQRRGETTSARRRGPALAALGLLALWLFGGFLYSLSTHGVPLGLEGHRAGQIFWLSHFKMFTELRPEHAELRATRARAGALEAVDLDRLFPMRWQAGPGYDRPQFARNPERLRQLARATCRRLDPPGGELRLSWARWEKTPGSAHQPERGLREEPLLALACPEAR